jgi:geranylgeranyl diphosphate synthase type II
MNFADYLAEQRNLVDRELDRLIPSEQTPPEIIHRAMRYSLFAGGKRVRPVLCLAAAGTVSDSAARALPAACALECIHTYSLIHDDLPALDNDDFRRGVPTCHKQFGEAMAILAGDSLLTVAFQLLARMEGVDETRRIALVEELAAASGTVGGMIGGQVFDLEGERQPPTAELLERIHRAKTGALLRASVRIGAICGGASGCEIEALTRFGERIGLAFQIVDDILDVEQSSETLGKTAGKDAEQHKITFPAVYGLDVSHRMAREECAAAIAALAPFGPRARRLREIAELVVQRTQ